MTDELERQPRIVHGEPCPEDNRVGVLVQTPYDRDFVEELKGEIPHQERCWDPDEKVWWAELEHGAFLEELVEYHFGYGEVVDEAGNSRYFDGSGEYAQEGLF